MSPLSCTYLFDLGSTSQRVGCPWVPISSRCMAFPCIGMLAQSSARGLREAQDLSTVVSAAIKGAASLGLRWANLEWDQAVPICRFGGGWNSQGACYQFYNIYTYIYIYMYGGGVDFFLDPPLSRPCSTFSII